jgi:hypothetical protein
MNLPAHLMHGARICDLMKSGDLALFGFSVLIDPSRIVIPFFERISFVLPKPSSSSWTWLMNTFLCFRRPKIASGIHWTPGSFHRNPGY